MSEHDVVINYLSSLDNVVPAPMGEDLFGIVQPLECAWTNHAKRCELVGPAPMREEANGNDQPLDSAGT